ncbi:transcriptional regulator, GntR family [Pseudonocardia thermophila]|jgi:Transcriptional regulators|uniref:Transcriptional regulator, GntR family n=1 Tax=Pseudonocardia thermophila TaxID=1848 RepID=A0A1M7A0U3_PSETH|nr:FCD domain-containing protein [Pseudonocardia thermophila]SHL36334.1 transcriptional regulator, GntR family [Pseudonocardia thermophila]
MAAPKWGPVERVATYELVIEKIEEQLVSGALGPGDRLPPERELAALLGASRQAVREALRVLQALGIVRSRQGTGSDAGTVIVPAPAHALSRVLRLHLAVSSFPAADLTGARVLLERASAAAAAERRDPEAIARLRELLTAMDADLGREEFSELDTKLHVAIAGSAGNQLVGELTAAVRESLRGALLDGMRAEPDWPTLRDQLRREHRGVVEAIEAGDAPLAADRLERHIRAFHVRIDG